jgi:hypothetical protein
MVHAHIGDIGKRRHMGTFDCFTGTGKDDVDTFVVDVDGDLYSNFPLVTVTDIGQFRWWMLNTAIQTLTRVESKEQRGTDIERVLNNESRHHLSYHR